MKEKGFSIREAISFGWEEMKKNFIFFMAFLILLLSVQMVTRWLFVRPDFDLITQIGMIIGLIVSTLVGFAVRKVALDAANNQTLSLNNLRQVLPRYLNYFLLQVITSILVFAGFLILIIPGIIWSLQFSMAPYLVIEKDMNPIEALKESSRMTKGRKWRLFVLGLTLALINLAGLLVFIVGIFSTLPTSMVAEAYIYNKLKE